MHQLLAKIFQKRGIERFDDLDDKTLPDGSPSEKQIFENWQKILTKEQLTTEDIKRFCQSQIDIIEGRWSDYEKKLTDKAELIPYHTVYRTILRAIDAPKTEKENLEKTLQNFIR